MGKVSQRPLAHHHSSKFKKSRINKLKIVVEPSSAVVLAALIKNKNKFKNKNIGLIMCGGNIDFNSLKF